MSEFKEVAAYIAEPILFECGREDPLLPGYADTIAGRFQSAVERAIRLAVEVTRDLYQRDTVSDSEELIAAAMLARLRKGETR